jgi:pyrimidine 5'-nucleotidase
VFDLDNTLYPAECDLFAEIDTRMTDFVARLTGLERLEARKLQKHYYATYGTTLSGLMTEHGLDPAEFLHYVHEIDLSPLPDLPHLRAAIAPHPHALHRGGMLGTGPAAQALQQVFGGGIQGKSAHIGRGVGMGIDQAHPQAQARQKQGQALPHHAGTADTDIECGFHGA